MEKISEGPLVSVIVPAYNAEKYLCQAIDSIVQQTMQEIEIVCIDDGSTDRTPHILDDYEKKYDNVRVFHKKNEGLVKARKDGVKLARADLIAFVDSDDWIESDMLKYLYQTMVSKRVDMVSTGYIRNENDSIQLDRLAEGVYRNDGKQFDLYKELLMRGDRRSLSIIPNVWDKLYRKSILEKVIENIDDRIHYHEDDCLVYSYLLECNSFAIEHKAFYHYRYNQESMTRVRDEYFFARINLVYVTLKRCFEVSEYRDVLLPQLDQFLAYTMLEGINSMAKLDHKAYVVWNFLDNVLEDYENIVIYGAGVYGMEVLKYIEERTDKQVVAIVDKRADEKQVCGYRVLPPDSLLTLEYDKILVAIKKESVVDEVIDELVSMGVSKKFIKHIRLS